MTRTVTVPQDRAVALQAEKDLLINEAKKAGLKGAPPDQKLDWLYQKTIEARLELKQLKQQKQETPTPRLRQTYTFAILEVSDAVYDEIAGKLRDAGYDHVFVEGGEGSVMDMHGIAIGKEGSAG